MSKFECKSFLRNFYLTGFFYEFIFAYAIYTLLFSLRGLSVFEIALLIAWWAAAGLVFEIPGGGLISRIWDLQSIYLSTAVILLLLALGTAAFGRKTGGPPSAG